VELMPCESREITAQYVAAGALDGGTELTVSGWNITSATIPLGEAKMAASHSGGGN